MKRVVQGGHQVANASVVTCPVLSPRCMHCMQRRLVTRKLSVRLSNAWFMT